MDSGSTSPRVNLSKLRDIVEDNLKLHQYQNSLYWADKVMTLSGEMEDVLVCANCLYLTGQYHRAMSLVKLKTDCKVNAKSVLLIGNCHLACKEYEQVISTITDYVDPDSENLNPNKRKKTNKANPQVMSSLHLLLGKAYEAMGNYDLAAQEFRCALRLDVYCYEAFDKLVGHHLLTSAEEKALIDELPFTKQCKNDENRELINLLYNVQLNKYAAHDSLVVPSELSALEENMDVVVNLANRFYYNCYYRDALRITSKVLERDPFHMKCLPLHIALLVELGKPRELFYLAHKLVDTYPHSVVSWFGVACYYHLIQNNDLARQYFSKATTIDPLFGPAWLAFGHSFAAESEHDQAMAAYFSASKFMKGCHLPFFYIGLEYGLTSTTKLAEKFFLQAQKIAPNDPFVLHEIAVIEYQNGQYSDASQHMTQALQKIESLDMKRMSKKWEPLLNNMAHVCRKLKKYEQAIDYHKKCLVLRPKCASTYAAIGYNHMLMLDFQTAIDYFHKALSLKRNDTFTCTLLNTALEELCADTSSVLHIIGSDYQPPAAKGKLDLSLLQETNEHIDSASVLQTNRDRSFHEVLTPRQTEHTVDNTLSDVDMDMSMDDL